MPAGQFHVGLFMGGALPGVHVASPELWIQTTAQCKGMRITGWVQSYTGLKVLRHKEKLVSHMMVPAAASTDPNKGHTHV